MSANLRPKPFPETDEREVLAIQAFKRKINIKYVKADIKERDKFPNEDGHLTLVDEARIPVGKICCQVKAIPKDQKKFNCELSLFGHSAITNDPFILVCVDVDNEIVFWKLLNPDDLEGKITDDQKWKTIHFADCDLVDETELYLKEWLSLTRKYQERSRKIPSVGLTVATETDVTSIVTSETADSGDSASDQPYKEQAQKAKTLLESQRHQAAREIYEEIMRSTNNGSTLSRIFAWKIKNNLASCLLKLGASREAGHLFIEAHETISPETELACRNRAVAYLLLETPVEGLKYIDSAITMNPNSNDNIAVKSALLRALGRNEEALALYLETEEPRDES